jgi:hypothetical protein
MTLPVSGAISFNAINVELGVAGTTQADINQATYRTLAGVPGSGTTISLNNFYGKSNIFDLTKTISSNTQNYNLLTDMQANGYTNGNAFTVNLTIGSGVYIWTDTTATAAFDTGAISGTGTITITNNGYIMGKGGRGGQTASLAGLVGGPAINLQKSVTINNTNGSAYIGGGGGGGGIAAASAGPTSAGGGAGGGPGGTSNGAGGTGGAIGAIGNTGAVGMGAGGGRIFPGTGGSGKTATSYPTQLAGDGGGAGGGAGIAATIFKSTRSCNTPGGGGGWGATGGTGYHRNSTSNQSNMVSGSGGAGNAAGGNGSQPSGTGGLSSQAGSGGGKAVNLNGNAVTWTSGDTTRVYGAVS